MARLTVYIVQKGTVISLKITVRHRFKRALATLVALILCFSAFCSVATSCVGDGEEAENGAGDNTQNEAGSGSPESGEQAGSDGAEGETEADSGNGQGGNGTEDTPSDPWDPYENDKHWELP